MENYTLTQPDLMTSDLIENMLTEFSCYWNYTEISSLHWEHSSEKKKIRLTKNIFKVQWNIQDVTFKQCKQTLKVFT